MKKTLCTLLIIGTLITLPTNFTSVKALTGSSEVDTILQSIGYDEDILGEMEMADKLEIADAVSKDPTSVEVQTSVLSINNISLLEYYTNTEESELVESGLTVEEIDKIKDKIEDLNEMSENKIKEAYDVSSSEAKMIKMATKKNPKYIKKDIKGKEVTTSGSISTSEMTFYQTVSNKSTSTAPSYDVTISYNWAKPYFTDIFTDSLGVAWGGNMNVKNVSSTAKYYYGNYWNGAYSDLKQTTSWSRVDTPNKGIEFQTPQSKNGAAWQNKTGTIKATVYQTKFQGYDTLIISQFGHKMLSLTGAGVSISGSGPSVSLSFTTAYDTSPQRRATVGY